MVLGPVGESDSEIFGPITITATSTNAFLVQKADGTDVFNVNTTNQYISVSDGGSLVVGSSSPLTLAAAHTFQILGTADADSAGVIARFSADSNQPKLEFLKSRSAVIGNHAIVQDGDNLGAIKWYPDDGVDFATGAAFFEAEVDDPSPAAGDIGVAFSWRSMAGGGAALAEKMRLTAAGGLGVSDIGSGEVNTSYVFATATVNPALSLTSNSNTRLWMGSATDTATQGPFIVLSRARTNFGAPTVVQAGDLLGSIFAIGYDGTDYASSAAVRFEAFSGGTFSSTSMPGQVELQTVANGTASLTTRVTVGDIGQIDFLRGANTTNLTASAESISYTFDNSATKTFATGALSIQRGFRFIPETIAFAGASTASVVCSQDFGGLPLAGSNATFSSTFGQLFGDVSGAASAVGNASQAAFIFPGIKDGVGNLTYLTGIQFISVGDVSLGNQTASLSELIGISVDPGTFVSSTNTRTVTDAWAIRALAPVASTNVVFTNSGAAYLSGNVKIVTTLNSYVSGTGLLDVTRSATLTGGAGDIIADCRIRPSVTLTEPGSGSVGYYGIVSDLSNISVTAGAGTSVLAAYYAYAGADADAGANYAFFAERGVSRFDDGITFAASGQSTLDTYINWTSYSATITLVGGAGNTVPVYSTVQAYYRRVGDTVKVKICFDGDGGNEGAGTGNYTIALPTTVASTITYQQLPAGFAYNGGTQYILFTNISGGGSTASIYYASAINAISGFTGADQNNTSRGVQISFDYISA